MLPEDELHPIETLSNGKPPGQGEVSFTGDPVGMGPYRAQLPNRDRDRERGEEQVSFTPLAAQIANGQPTRQSPVVQLVNLSSLEQKKKEEPSLSEKIVDLLRFSVGKSSPSSLTEEEAFAGVKWQ